MATSNTLTRASLQYVLSPPRFEKYEIASSGDHVKASDLYAWNAAASAALLLPSHFAEVSIRNAASEALTTTYGDHWPWEAVFEQSLPSPGGLVYNPRKDLIQTRLKYPNSTGKVVADLKLAFWESMFTGRHDERIWNAQIRTVLPNSAGVEVRVIRNRVREDIQQIRKLRNRIAHHEPIFTRNLNDDLDRMLDLIDLRSKEVAAWVRDMESFSSLPAI